MWYSMLGDVLLVLRSHEHPIILLPVERGFLYDDKINLSLSHNWWTHFFHGLPKV